MIQKQTTTQQKSKWLFFQFVSRWAKLDARFSPYSIFTPFNRKKKKKTFLRTFPDALSFRSLLFHSTSLLPYESWPFGYFFAVCRYKGEESEMENMLFGRMIIVIKKLRERWWKSVSLLPWVGGSRCCYPIGISCPRAVLTEWLFFVARD